MTPPTARGLQLCHLDVEVGTRGFGESNLRREGWQKGRQETEKEIEKEQSLPKNSVAQDAEGRGAWAEGSQSCPEGQRKQLRHDPPGCAGTWHGAGNCGGRKFPFFPPEAEAGRWAGRASPRSPALTGGAQEGAVELSGNQRIRHVPQKLLQQSSHIVDALVLVQENIQSLVKLFPQLEQGRTEENKASGEFFLSTGATLPGAVPAALDAPDVGHARAPSRCCPEQGPRQQPELPAGDGSPAGALQCQPGGGGSSATLGR